MIVYDLAFTLLIDTAFNLAELPETETTPQIVYWVDNNDNYMRDNLGNRLIFTGAS